MSIALHVYIHTYISLKPDICIYIYIYGYIHTHTQAYVFMCACLSLSLSLPFSLWLEAQTSRPNISQIGRGGGGEGGTRHEKRTS